MCRNIYLPTPITWFNAIVYKTAITTHNENHTFKVQRSKQLDTPIYGLSKTQHRKNIHDASDNAHSVDTSCDARQTG